MPHIIVEYTDNVTIATKALAKQMHQSLAAELPTKVSSCKSRFIQLSDYLIGNGEGDGQFIHVTIQAFATRTEDKYQNAAEAIIADIKDHVSEAVAISVSVEMLPALYFKS